MTDPNTSVQPTPSSLPRRLLRAALKLALVAGLLTFLVRRGLLSWEQTVQAVSHYEMSGPAFLLLWVIVGVSFYRWHGLMAAQGVRLGGGLTLRLGLIGTFFNLALPGSVSGDLVKAYYVAKETPGSRGRVFGAILFDRVLGLVGQLIVALVALWIGFAQLAHSPVMAQVRLIVTVAGGLFAGFFAYLFLVPERADLVHRVLARLTHHRPRMGSVLRVYEGIRHFRTRPMAVLWALLLSVAMHCGVAFACWRFAGALEQTQLELVPMMVVVPLGLLVTAIPIFPAGIGTGHAALGGLVHLLGSARGADIFSLFAIAQLLTGAVGGLVYLRYRPQSAGPVSSTVSESCSSGPSSVRP